MLLAGGLAYAVGSSPGWARVQATFFDPATAWESLPAVLRELWLDIRVLVVAAIAGRRGPRDRPRAGRDGMTTLTATHEMGFAEQVSDLVHFLDGGRLLESGPPEQVLGDPVEDRTRRFLARVVEAGRLG